MYVNRNEGMSTDLYSYVPTQPVKCITFKIIHICRSAFVNPLIPDGPREEEVFKQGACK